MRAIPRIRSLAVGVLVFAGAAALGLRMTVLRRDLPPAERGRRVAETEGCFTCHGPGGTRGAANPGRADLSVPTFEGDVMMYARDRSQIREWIRDGVSAAKSKSRTWQTERDRGALVMPAFGSRIAARRIDDLVEFVAAASRLDEPVEGAARRGLERADSLGCFGCHGRGGRLAPPNPRSLKGYIPSWDGRDFAEIVRDRAEFDEWVESGISRRFRSNPLARFFLRRANIHMPGYRNHLRGGDLDSLWAYIVWLRDERGDR